MTETDPDLWQRFKEGDRAAFETLLQDHYRPLYLYGRKFCGEEQAKDLVHDLFVHLWERREKLTPVDNAGAYLFRSLRNSILKQQQGRQIHFHDAGDLENTDHLNIEQQIISFETTTESSLKVHRIIGLLTDRQQEAVHLKFFQNLSNEQISKVMNISSASVSNLLSQALRLFKDKWSLFLFFFLSDLH